MKIDQVTPNALLITFGDVISKETSHNVQKAYISLVNIPNLSFIEIIPSYTTIFITYDIFKYNLSQIKKILLEHIDLTISLNTESEIVEIDVYYGIDVGLDLQSLSSQTNLSIDDIILLHSQTVYDVYAIGFLPGFGFLGQVDQKIAVPRLSTPRKKVPKGSVAIANTQTAVYPQDSAGGWNIIGKSAKTLFDKSLPNLSILSIGKKVQFNPITKKKFLAQGGQL